MESPGLSNFTSPSRARLCSKQWFDGSISKFVSARTPFAITWRELFLSGVTTSSWSTGTMLHFSLFSLWIRKSQTWEFWTWFRSLLKGKEGIPSFPISYVVPPALNWMTAYDGNGCAISIFFLLFWTFFSPLPQSRQVFWKRLRAWPYFPFRSCPLLPRYVYFLSKLLRLTWNFTIIENSNLLHLWSLPTSPDITDAVRRNCDGWYGPGNEYKLHPAVYQGSRQNAQRQLDSSRCQRVCLNNTRANRSRTE